MAEMLPGIYALAGHTPGHPAAMNPHHHGQRTIQCRCPQVRIKTIFGLGLVKLHHWPLEVAREDLIDVPCQDVADLKSWGISRLMARRSAGTATPSADVIPLPCTAKSTEARRVVTRDFVLCMFVDCVSLDPDVYAGTGVTVRTKPRYTLHEGFRMPLGFPVDGFLSASEYQPRPKDIFISTYPKCGTTWMQHMVWLILHQGEPLGPDDRMTEAVPHLEEVGRERVEELPDPRVIKTHLPFAMSPHHPEARFVYVARNPFDCAVSFYHHTKGFVQHYDFSEGSFDDYFECFVRGEVDFGDYFENVLSWFAHRNDPNLLFVTYENMKADPERAILSVGEFLGPEHDATVRDESLRHLILEHSGFDSMSRDQTRWASERPDGASAFVRKGVVGDWLNHFSPEHTQRLLARIQSIPGARELAGLWPEVMAEAQAHANG